MKELGVLVIHGMGDETPDFDEGIRSKLEAKLGAATFARIAWQPVHWAPEVAPAQRDMWDAVRVDADLDWKPVRRFFLDYFADALAYQRYGYRREADSTYERIQDVVHSALVDLDAKLGPDRPLVVLAHSLGAYVITSYTWDRQRWDASTGVDPRGTSGFTRMEHLAGIVTFGCNLPFFAFGAKVPKTIKFPGAALPTHLAATARWLNFYDADDVLGWPIKNVYVEPQETIDLITDYQVNVGIPLLQSSNPLSHLGYWKDNDMVGPVAEYLQSVLDAVPA